MQFLRRGRWLLAVVILCLITACGNPAGTQSPSQTAPTPPVKVVPPGAEAATPSAQLPQLQGKATVVLQVNSQPITIEVNGLAAPVTAGNFVDLVNRGVYDGTSFHRVVREPTPFVVQGGDPQSKDPNTPVNRLGTGDLWIRKLIDPVIFP